MRGIVAGGGFAEKSFRTPLKGGRGPKPLSIIVDNSCSMGGKAMTDARCFVMCIWHLVRAGVVKSASVYVSSGGTTLPYVTFPCSEADLGTLVSYIAADGGDDGIGDTSRRFMKELAKSERVIYYTDAQIGNGLRNIKGELSRRGIKTIGIYSIEMNSRHLPAIARDMAVHFEQSVIRATLEEVLAEVVIN